MDREQSPITLRIVVAGILCVFLMVTVNLYMGLKTGFGEPGSVLAAILCFVVLRLFGQRISIHENNIGQTIASAGGSIGNMVNVVPALIMLGHPLNVPQVILWTLSVSLLGLYFAVPFRQQLVVREKLPFPSGATCARVLQTLQAGARQSMAHVAILVALAGVAGIVVWLRDGIWKVIPKFVLFSGNVGSVSLPAFGFGFALNPLLLGVGAIVGLRVGLGLVAGAVLFWYVLPALSVPLSIPMLADPEGAEAWMRWPGVGIIVSSSLVTALLALGALKRVFASSHNLAADVSSPGPLSFKAWLAGLLVLSAAVVVMLWYVLQIPPYLGALSVLGSFVLCAVSIRIFGETDMNLAGPVSHVTQLLFAPFLPGAAATVGVAGATEGAVSVAGDLMQDLKTGHLIGTSPRSQFHAQIIGVVIGCLAIVPVFFLLTSAYGLGSDLLPAPAATTFKTLADGLARGEGALPPGCGWAVVIATVLGGLISLLSKTGVAAFLPSAVGLGVAALLPPCYSFSIGLGAVAAAILKTLWKREDRDELIMLAGAGLIAGESVMGVLCALLAMVGLA